MKYLILIALTIGLSSCGANFYLKRAKLNILKAEARGAKWQRDTVYRERAVPVPSFEGDTTIKWVTINSDSIKMERFVTGAIDYPIEFMMVADTLRLKKKGIDTKVKIGPKTVYIKTVCTPDTVKIIEREVTMNNIDCLPCVQFIKWWWALIALIVIFVVGYFLGKLTK